MTDDRVWVRLDYRAGNMLGGAIVRVDGNDRGVMSYDDMFIR